MIESHRLEDDALLYGEDRPGGGVFLQDADALDRSDLYFDPQGLKPDCCLI